MKTSDAVVDRAFELAEMRRDDDTAVDELVAIAMGRRVSLVMARQGIVDGSSGVVSDLTQRVVALIDRAIEKTEALE